MGDVTPTLEKYQFDNLIVLKRRTAAAVFAEERYSDAFDYPTHLHKQAYFMLPDQCTYRETLGSKTFYHSPGTVLWRPANISHSDSMAETNGRSFSVYIRDGLLEKYSDYARAPIEFAESNTYLVFLTTQLRNEFRNWAQGSEMIAEGLVLEMLGYAAKKQIPAEKRPPKWVEKIVERLEDEFQQDHNNLELANEVDIHPIHLARTFRKYYGKSIGTFLKEKRVHHAMQMIIAEDRSLAEIACSSGFSDQSQLTRAFKDIVGITPGAFRKEMTSRQ